MASERDLEGIKLRKYCYSCGTPWPSDLIHCPACKGRDYETGHSRPQIEAKDDAKRYDEPWNMLPWPTQGAVSVTGPPGSGKSSLATMIEPRHWLSSEQDPKPVGSMFRRMGRPVPIVHRVQTPKHVNDAIRLITRGPIVLDSVSAFGLMDALIVSKMMLEWAKDNNDRALCVLQVNARGDAAGYMAIPHLFDAHIMVEPDPFGVRALHIEKSRWSPTGSRYWVFGEGGKIELPSFNAAYSVEGNSGNYNLHPHPMKGSKWSGLLAKLETMNLLNPRTASAAHPALYMPSGFIEPHDVAERRRFAEDHGLEWLSPDDFAEDEEE